MIDMTKLNEVVKTFDGTPALRSNCKFIKGEYYEKNRQCFYIDGQWYRINSGKIVYDHAAGCYVLDNKASRRIRSLSPTNLFTLAISSSGDFHIIEHVPHLSYENTVKEMVNSFPNINNQYTGGVVDVKDDGTLVFGMFSVNVLENIYAVVPTYYLDSAPSIIQKYIFRFKSGHNYTIVPMISYKLAEKHNKFFVVVHDMAVYINHNAGIKLNDALVSDPIGQYITWSSHWTREMKSEFYNMMCNYTSDFMIPVVKTLSDKLFVPHDVKLKNKNIKLLKDYSFGIEFETSAFAIPERYLYPNGLIVCKDGSITGFEYATVPLSGKRGLQMLYAQCKLLSEYCKYDKDTSLHVHMKGYPRTIEHIVALYILGLKIQDSVYSIFPPLYKKTGVFKSTRKSYNNPLTINMGYVNSIKELCKELNDPDKELGTFTASMCNGILTTLSGSDDFSIYNVVEEGLPSCNHPLDRDGDHKWNVYPRYVWMNMISFIWGNRGTIEFRCHPPTFNFKKIVYWLFICKAILDYAKKHSRELIEAFYRSNTPLLYRYRISLHTVINDVYAKEPTVRKALISYINRRIEYYKKRIDSIGTAELEKPDMFVEDNVYNIV